MILPRKHYLADLIVRWPMLWNEYFEKTSNKSPRPILVKALALFSKSTSASQAIDLGCGSGNETIDLIKRGFNVHAIDGQKLSHEYLLKNLSPSDQLKLTFTHSTFEEIKSLPRCDLFFAYHSIPFCSPQYFSALLSIILASLNPNGLFVGSFFGEKDEWVGDGSKMSGITKQELLHKFINFEILSLEEIDEVGQTCCQGMKKWHYFEIIARRLE